MYESFYGLNGKPFQLNPDPSFFYASRPHRRAMAYLEYGLHQNEGFIVVTGEVGAGKTTLVRSHLARLDQNDVIAAQLVSTQLGADDTLRLVAAAFGINIKNVEKSDLLLSIEAHLLAVAKQGKRCLLVVDEAQNLTAQAIEELRMLSNFQLESHALLQSFLIGQPEFRQVLYSEQMLQLRQRVIAACHIGPMDLEETQGYVEHRLHLVGWSDSPRFEAGAFAAIFAASGGIPRRINSICDRLLLAGYLAGRRVFTGDDVAEVAQEIDDETRGRTQMTDPDGRRNTTATLEPAALGPLHGLDAALAKLNYDDVASRLERIEEQIKQIDDSLVRLERRNVASLTLFRQIVDGLSSTKAQDGDPT